MKKTPQQPDMRHASKARGHNLRQIGDLWHLTIDTIPDDVALIGVDRTILCCNKAMERSIGVSRDELRGALCHQSCHGAATPPPTCPMTLTLDDGLEHTAEIWEESRGKCQLVTTVPHFDERGELVGCVHIARDITTHRLLDEELERRALKLKDANALLAEALRQATRLAEEAKAANRTKDEFLATISHELRTPLNAMAGFSELLLDSALNEEQRGYVDAVKARSLDLAKILDDIIDLAKIEAGVMEIGSESLDLVRVVSEVAGAVHPQAMAKGLSFDVSIGPEVPGILLGDALRLKQILLNLLGNAMKFTEKGGVRIAVDVASRSKTSHEPCIMFSVADTGIGVPADKRELIFLPFTQVDGSFTKRHGGVGLGLAICKRLVEKMGGEIWVESEAGTGATFKFIVPFQLAAPPAPIAAAPETGTAARAMRVLVVDDDPMSVQYAAVVLAHGGHHVETAVNGGEALRMASRHPFDLILMDVQMPDMCGVDAMKAIRDLEEKGLLTPLNGNQRIRIVAYAAFAMIGDKEKFLAAGMDDYLAKPLRKDALLAMVNDQRQQPVL